MKKLRFILLSAVLAAVFGFSFIGCSNYSSNGGSSNHDMTIKLKVASEGTITYYADYAANDNLAKGAASFNMIVFNSDGTEITDVSVYHKKEGNYTIIFDNEINRRVFFQTIEPYKFTSDAKDSEKVTKEIEELTINGKKYELEVNNI